MTKSITCERHGTTTYGDGTGCLSCDKERRERGAIVNKPIDEKIDALAIAAYSKDPVPVFTPMTQEALKHFARAVIKAERGRTSIVLNIQQIVDLAIAAGLSIETDSIPTDEDELECEMIIIESKSGIKILDEPSGQKMTYTHVAYFDGYPEEGYAPLGKEVQS